MFENVQISFFFYIVIVILLSMVVFAAIGMMIYTYYQGKPLAKFFLARIKGWGNPRIALFEIFGITNNINFEYAHSEIGDGYRLGETKKQKKIPEKKKGIKRIIQVCLEAKKEVEIKKESLIIPKSTYVINGVKTIPLFDIHPRLHEDIEKGINRLIELKIYTLKDLEDEVDKKPHEILFEEYSYKKWYELYITTKNKYNIEINTSDVLDFVEKNFDKNFRESIKAKDFNMMMEKKNNIDKYTKYGWAAILLSIGIVGFRAIYITIWG